MKNEYEIGVLGEQPFLETEEEGELRRRGRTSRATAWRRPGIVPRRPPMRPRPRPRPRPGGGVGFPMPFPGFPGMDQPTGSGQGGPSTPTPSPQAQGEEKVRWVQNSLNSILNSRLPVDGVMGVESRIAVREFQKKQGLPVTGFVGPDTEQALVAATRTGGATAATGGATAEPATSSGGDGNGQGQATDDSELLTELGISPELGLESEFEFGNILELELNGDRETGSDTRIIDLTAKANKSLRKKMRDPKTVDTLVLHQMACCFKVKDPMTRFLKNMAPHFAILADGRILQFHPTQALTWASNGFNTNSVAVEFAGNFPSTKGKWWLDRKYLQKLTKTQAQAYIKANQNRVTPEQIEAGRHLVKHLIRTMGLKKIVSHRQSSNTRENDPGPDIWYHVGQWAIENLGLSDGGSGYKVGTGAAIPEIWRTWGRKATQQPELLAEFMETEVIEGAALGVAVFQVIQSIVSSGDLSVQSDVARYVHQNTPAHIAFTRRSIEFKISAHHPRYGIDRQNFYFRLSFEYNKYDLRNVTISVLRDKSSSLYSSSFDINFKATDYSQPTDPVTSIAYNIVNGRWDPVGLGDVSFSATPLLVIKADGSITPRAINSEKDWVRFDGWTAGTLQDTPLAAPSTPGITPQPPTPGAPGSTLRMGSRGAAVSEMQIRLNRWLVSQGRAPLEVDGAFGPKTRAAVITFQGALRLVQDGVVGPQTQAALRNY